MDSNKKSRISDGGARAMNVVSSASIIMIVDDSFPDPVSAPLSPLSPFRALFADHLFISGDLSPSESKIDIDFEFLTELTVGMDDVSKEVHISPTEPSSFPETTLPEGSLQCDMDDVDVKP
ncbi:hypothetical protein ACLOJK_027312 [Asimina triloba]